MASKDEHHEHGMSVLRELTDEHGIEMIQSYEKISPEFVDMMISFGFGQVYAKNTLEIKEHTMITISSLVSQGMVEQLPFHIRAGIRVGIPPKKIIEIILQCAAYAGFPKAASALRITGEVFSELGVDPQSAESK